MDQPADNARPRPATAAAFARLARSRFRARFHLTGENLRYIAEKGLDTIRRHAADFVRTRLAPACPPHDGRQTPMRGHPVFKAQHATATCCRGCLEKWWKVPRGTDIPPARQARIVDFLMAWIDREIDKAPHFESKTTKKEKQDEAKVQPAPAH